MYEDYVWDEIAVDIDSDGKEEMLQLHGRGNPATSSIERSFGALDKYRQLASGEGTFPWILVIKDGKPAYDIRTDFLLYYKIPKFGKIISNSAGKVGVQINVEPSGSNFLDAIYFDVYISNGQCSWAYAGEK